MLLNNLAEFVPKLHARVVASDDEAFLLPNFAVVQRPAFPNGKDSPTKAFGIEYGPTWS